MEFQLDHIGFVLYEKNIFLSQDRGKNTVLPRLVRWRTIKLSSFSGGVLTDRAY